MIFPLDNDLAVSFPTPDARECVYRQQIQMLFSKN